MTPSHNLFSTNHVLFWTLSFLLLSHPITAQTLLGDPLPKNGGSELNLKVAVIMVVLVVIFFILGFLSFYTRRCAQTRFQGRVDLALLNDMTHGLNPDVIATFPTFIYSTVKELKLGLDALECAVCLNEFQDDETLRLIPKCDHVFHLDCIDTWLISHSTCPVCRAYLVPKPGELPCTLIEQLQMYNGQDNEPCQLEPVPKPVPQQLLPRQVSNRVIDDQIKKEESPGVNSAPVAPPRSRSTGFRPLRSRSMGMHSTSVLFPRSHSTGHSLVQPGENIEKFTLRLPEEVRTQLMNAALTRAKSTSVAFSRAGSMRKGYRNDSGRGKINGYEQFDANSQSNHWTFSMMPPFISRTGSVRQHVADNDVANPSMAAPSGSKRTLSDHTSGNDQRLSDALRQEGQV